MSNVTLNIDSRATVQFTNTLEKLHRSALPVAVRQALSKAALHTKTVTMPAESDVFVHRKPTFFKATSKVEFAKGFDLRVMQATVGFIPPASDKVGAVKELEQQEDGGEIGGKSFVSSKEARVGSKWVKNVRDTMRISKIRSLIKNSSRATGKNAGQRFIKSAIFAKKLSRIPYSNAGADAYVMGNTTNSSGNKALLKINSVKRVGRNTVVKSTVVSHVRRSRKVHPKATHFMRKASLESAKEIEGFYIAEAERQILKFKSKIS